MVWLSFSSQGYFDTLRTEVYYHNIAITNVCPGPVATRIIENAVQKDFHQVGCFFFIYLLWYLDI